MYMNERIKSVQNADKSKKNIPNNKNVHKKVFRYENMSFSLSYSLYTDIHTRMNSNMKIYMCQMCIHKMNAKIWLKSLILAPADVNCFRFIWILNKSRNETFHCNTANVHFNNSKRKTFVSQRATGSVNQSLVFTKCLFTSIHFYSDLIWLFFVVELFAVVKKWL